jgi:hypothetical protein
MLLIRSLPFAPVDPQLTSWANMILASALVQPSIQSSAISRGINGSQSSPPSMLTASLKTLRASLPMPASAASIAAGGQVCAFRAVSLSL